MFIMLFYQISLWKPSSEAKRLQGEYVAPPVQQSSGLRICTTRPKATLRITIGPCATLVRPNTHVAKTVGVGAENAGDVL